MAGTSPKNLDCLDVLNGNEASAVLREILSSHLELIPYARQAANALLATMSFTAIALVGFELVRVAYLTEGPAHFLDHCHLFERSLQTLGGCAH